MIYIVRHGETDWNIENRMQGHTDVPLNEKGRKQAEEIARDLKDVHFDIIYTSPLTRAYETATIINKQHKVPIIKDTALQERQFGLLEGKTYEEVNKFHPALIFSETWNYPDYRPPGGESVNDISKRIHNFTKQILKTNSGKSILLVSHGVALRILVGSFLGTPPEQLERLRMKNASLTIIEISGGKPTLHVINYQAMS
jgi:alpha-ribazole phosphatase/probable phosphoglycerate mutase